METHTATRSLIRSVRSFLVCLRCVLHFSSVCSPQALLGEGVSWSCSGVCDALVACISREFRSFRSSFYIQVLSDFIRISRLPKFPSSFGVRKPGAMERFAAQHTCFVSGSVTIVIFPSFKMKIDEWAVRELESPHANGILCRDLLFPGIHSPGGLGRRGGGAPKKKKFSGLHTRSCFFVFWPPPPPPAGRHSWSHTLRPCPLSSTPRTSCESLLHLDLCSISQTNLKSFQSGKRRNFK